MKIRALLGFSTDAGPSDPFRSFEEKKAFNDLEFLLEILEVDGEGFTAIGRAAFYALARSALEAGESAGVLERKSVTNHEVESAVENDSVPLEKEGMMHFAAEDEQASNDFVADKVVDQQERERILRTFWMFLRVLRLTRRVSH